MKFNRREHYNSESLETHWDKRTVVYDMGEVIYELAGRDGIEGNISAIRQLLVLILESMEEEKVLKIVNKMNTGPDFIKAS